MKFVPCAHAMAVASDWFENLFHGRKTESCLTELYSIRQGHSIPCQINQSLERRPLKIGKKTFKRGVAVHGVSEIKVSLDSPAKIFTAKVGRDENPITYSQSADMTFNVDVKGKCIFQSKVIHGGEAALPISVPLDGATEFTLRVDGTKSLEGAMPWAHADWVDAQIELANGKKLWLDEIPFVEMRPELAGQLPFSFTYGGKSSREFLSTWKKSVKTTSLDANRTQTVITLDDSATQLRVTCEAIRYEDFPAAEWVVYFENRGTKDTPILEDIRSTDMAFQRQPFGEEYRLHYARGSHCAVSDFEPLEKKLLPKTQTHLAPDGGRSSGGTLPFFCLESSSGGVIGAIGWSGQWAADFDRDEKAALVVKTGMEKTHLTLHAGERIRTPRQLLFFWRGERIDAHNHFRQLILKHYSPKPNGQDLTYPISWAFWGMVQDTVHLNRIEMMKKHKLPMDVFWVDAGWYGKCAVIEDWYEQSGNWQINPKFYPNGMKPISDAAHSAGYKFLLWFDPERVYKDTDLYKAHPEWLLHLPAGEVVPGWEGRNDNSLLDMSNPDAQRWITDRMSEMITECGVDIFREDYNIQPLRYWQASDTPDRQGMTEIKYIEGFYAFWDAILERHPGLLIDNCASGGQRIDIETMKRSIPMWRSDLQCSPFYDPVGSQAQTLGLSHWVPLHSCGGNRTGDMYDFRSILSPGVDICWTGMETPDFPFDLLKQCFEEAALVRPFFLGDLYPLTGYSYSEEVWLAYQLHRADMKQGVILAFRRAKSPYPTAHFKLKGLNAKASYRIKNLNTKRSKTYTGAELMNEGLDVQMDTAPDSLILQYTEE